MDDKIMSFLRELYGIGSEEEKRFLVQLSEITDENKEKILISLYDRYEDINKAKQKFDIDLQLFFNKSEETIDNIVNI